MVEFDEVERRIKHALETIPAESLAAPEPWRDRMWTEEIKNRVSRIGHELKFYPCATCAFTGGLIKSRQGQGEWLYDATWLERTGEDIHDVPLALECEWRTDYPSIFGDFLKLLAARARNRIMIFQGKRVEETISRLVDRVREFRRSENGDRYLFAAFSSERRKFEFRLFVVGSEA